MKIKIWILVCFPAIIGLLLSGSSCKKGSEENNTTSPPLQTGSVTDIEGNVYKTVKIGAQWWMAENLKTTKYRDSTSILQVTDGPEWNNLTTPAYCWMNNDEANKNTYGALYNWFMVSTGKLAPPGWHVPTDEEWNTLVDFLGGESVAGGKMKVKGTIEEGTGVWYSPNTGASNESGFSGLPGSWRERYNGNFGVIGYGGLWWSATEDPGTGSAWYRNLSYRRADLIRNLTDKQEGLSVRCVKD